MRCQQCAGTLLNRVRQDSKEQFSTGVLTARIHLSYACELVWPLDSHDADAMEVSLLAVLLGGLRYLSLRDVVVLER